MGDGFRDYLEWSKPILDRAFERELEGVLGKASVRDASFLIPVLNEGKKIRGCLACIVGEALGAGFDATIPRAVAVELIQAATLIHDDFVDQDRVRRNRPAVWTLEGARRAVLIGDVVFASAIEMMSTLSREDGLALSHAIAQISKGALHEPLGLPDLVDLTQGDHVNGLLYETIIHLKTGVLFGTACKLGAIAADGSAEVREAADRYGLRTGEAYQIADDLKEVRQHLLSRTILPEQLLALTPAFLHFAVDMGPSILQFLEGGNTGLNEPMVEIFGIAADLMEKAIEGRLQSAVSEIEEHFPKSALTERLLKAPWGTIRMFNET